jgi:hypothetical protein
MDKPLEKRLTPRDAAVIAVALVVIAGALLVLCFRYWESGPGGDQQFRGKSIFEGLVLKRVELNIREYAAPKESGHLIGTESVYEDAQTVRSRPVKYLPAPTPLKRTPISTSSTFQQALQEQIEAQFEVAGIPVNAELPPSQEPDKKPGQRSETGLPGNSYLSINVEAEHTPDTAIFQVSCRLYRDIFLTREAREPIEIPITTPHTPRLRVRESDFRTAVAYEIEQMLQTYVIYSYRLTKERLQSR